jgi:hypothetical protein
MALFTMSRPGFEATQKTGGVTLQSVYRAKDDPSNCWLPHGFATTADAEAFLGGAGLRDAMQQGIQVQPRIEIHQDTSPVTESPAATDHRSRCRAGPVMRSRVSRPAAPSAGTAQLTL